MFILVNKDIFRPVTLYSYSVGPSACRLVLKVIPKSFFGYFHIIDVVSRSICTWIEVEMQVCTFVIIEKQMPKVTNNIILWFD